MAGSRRSRRSWAVIAVIVTLCAVFFVDVFGGLGLAGRFALIPSALLGALDRLGHDPASPGAWGAVLTIWGSLLVHADLTHLGFNLLYFWFFGSLLTDVAGNRWVLAALALTAVTSAAAFVLRHADGPTAGVLGASGAISGVAGLYVLLAFRWEIPDAHAWPLARPIPPLHAALIALVATATDVMVLRGGGADGVARDAHVGGFAGGLLLGAILTTFYPTWTQFLGSRLGPSGAKVS